MNQCAVIEIYGGGAGSGCNPEVAQPRCGRPSSEAPESSTTPKFGGSHYHYRLGSESRRVARVLQDGQWHPVAGLERNPNSTRRVDWANMRVTAHQHGMDIERRGGNVRFVRLAPDRQQELVRRDAEVRARYTPQGRRVASPLRQVTSPSTPTQSIGRTDQGTGLPISQRVPDLGLSGPTRERVFGVLQDGGWHTQSELETARTDTSHPRPAPMDEALGAIRDGAARNNYQLQDVEENGVRRFRLVPIEGGTRPTTDTPASIPTPAPTTPTPTPTPKPTSPSSALGAFGFNVGGRTEAGARVLIDGQWHTMNEFRDAVMREGNVAHYVNSADQALRIIGERANQRNLGTVETGTDGRIRLVAAPPVAPAPPTTSAPRPVWSGRLEDRKPKGFLQKSDEVPVGDLRREGIRIDRDDVPRFKEDFRMSPKDLKELVLRGLPEEATKNASVTINYSGGHDWSINTNTDAFDQDRNFSLGSSEPSVYHSSWTVNSSYQGKDIGKQVFNNQLDLYDHLGIKKVSVTAARSVGGYAWARFGFTPSDYDWNIVKRTVRSIADHLDLPANVKEQVKLITKIDDPKAISLLASLKDDDGKSVGKKLLLGTSWHGSINLDDRGQYGAVRAYASHRKQQSALAAMGLDLAFVFGKSKKDPLYDEMLKSEEGNKRSEKMAVDFALQHGWTLVQALKWFSDNKETEET